MLNSVSCLSNTGMVRGCEGCDCGKSQSTNLLKQSSNCDSVSFNGKESQMSDEEKKELILKARTKAAGYAVFGGPFSTLYYGLRSDEKVARKFDLDPVADKKLVKQIKKEQMMWTLPSAAAAILIGGGPVIGGGALTLVGVGTYLYNKCVADAGKIELK